MDAWLPEGNDRNRRGNDDRAARGLRNQKESQQCQTDSRQQPEQDVVIHRASSQDFTEGHEPGRGTSVSGGPTTRITCGRLRTLLSVHNIV